MSIFVQPVQARAPKNKWAGVIAIDLAIILVVLALAQLFTFEEFPSIIASFWLPGGLVAANFLAAFVVVCEVFTIPFLLRMKLSPAMRWVTMVLGWFAAAFWLFVALWLQATVHAVSNVGLLGDVINIAPGPLALALGILLVAMTAYASWGLWPYKLRKKRK